MLHPSSDKFRSCVGPQWFSDWNVVQNGIWRKRQLMKDSFSQQYILTGLTMSLNIYKKLFVVGMATELFNIAVNDFPIKKLRTMGVFRIEDLLKRLWLFLDHSELTHELFCLM